MLEEVEDIDKLLIEIEIGSSNSFRTGGIATKIEASRIVNTYGIPMILTNGKKEKTLLKIYNDETKATIFLTDKK